MYPDRIKHIYKKLGKKVYNFQQSLVSNEINYNKYHKIQFEGDYGNNAVSR